MHYTVYKLTNTDNNMTYVGATMDLERRLKEHQRARTCSILHTAIQEYGWDKFEVTELMHCDTGRDAALFEEYYIEDLETKFYGYNEYNTCHNNIGPQSEEACQKKRLAKLGVKRKPFTDEHRMNLSLAHQRRKTGVL